MGAAYLAEIKGRNSPNLGHNTIVVISCMVTSSGMIKDFLTFINHAVGLTDIGETAQ